MKATRSPIVLETTYAPKLLIPALASTVTPGTTEEARKSAPSPSAPNTNTLIVWMNWTTEDLALDIFPRILNRQQSVLIVRSETTLIRSLVWGGMGITVENNIHHHAAMPVRLCFVGSAPPPPQPLATHDETHIMRENSARIIHLTRLTE